MIWFVWSFAVVLTVVLVVTSARMSSGVEYSMTIWGVLVILYGVASMLILLGALLPVIIMGEYLTFAWIMIGSLMVPWMYMFFGMWYTKVFMLRAMVKGRTTRWVNWNPTREWRSENVPQYIANIERYLADSDNWWAWPHRVWKYGRRDRYYGGNRKPSMADKRQAKLIEKVKATL